MVHEWNVSFLEARRSLLFAIIISQCTATKAMDWWSAVGQHYNQRLGWRQVHSFEGCAVGLKSGLRQIECLLERECWRCSFGMCKVNWSDLQWCFVGTIAICFEPAAVQSAPRAFFPTRKSCNNLLIRFFTKQFATLQQLHRTFVEDILINGQLFDCLPAWHLSAATQQKWQHAAISLWAFLCEVLPGIHPS